MFNNANKKLLLAFGVLASDEAIVGGDGSRPGLTGNRLYDAYYAQKNYTILEGPIQRYQSMQ